MADTKKSVVVRVTPEFHQQLKMFTVANNISIQDYIVNLIEKDQKERGKVGVK